MAWYSKKVDDTKNTKDSFAALEEVDAFHSNKYNFSFAYPKNLDLLEYTDQDIAIGKKTENGLDAVAELKVIDDLDGVALKDAAVAQARLVCAADGPNETINCTDVESLRSFSPREDMTGYMFYLKEETTRPATGEVLKTQKKGPFYAVALSPNSFVLLHPPAPLQEDAVNVGLLQTIAETIEVTPLSE